MEKQEVSKSDKIYKVLICKQTATRQCRQINFMYKINLKPTKDDPLYIRNKLIRD